MPIQLALLLVVSNHSSSAQNFAPIARAITATVENLEGQPIQFSSLESIDPDEGPQPLNFTWDFGDGTTSNLPNPSHVFQNALAYRVSLTVSDGDDAAVDNIVVHVLAPPTSARPSHSSPIALRPASTELWVVNPDSDSVSILETAEKPPRKLAEIALGKQPRTIAFSTNGQTAFIACQGTNQLWVLNASNRLVVRRITLGHQPYGVAVSPVDGRILISNEGNGTVTVLTESLMVEKIFPVTADPRAVAITADSGFAYVTHFLTRGSEGFITEIDLKAMVVSRVIPLVEDPGPDSLSSGRGFPNMLSALSIDPAGRSLWYGGLKANTGRGLFMNGEMPTAENALRGFFGKVNLSTATDDLPRRIDANDTDSVSSIAFSPNGRYAYVTHQGAGTLSVYDISAATLINPGDANTVTFSARTNLGHAPQGIAVSTDGRFAYVANYLSRDVSVLSLSNPVAPVIIASIPVTAEPLPAPIANGKRLFYRSTEPRHSRANYIACASCHADGGGHDGRTWDFTNRGEGLRNTIDLRGRSGTDHGPVHWSANFDEIQDFENDIVNAFGGTGLAEDGQPPNPPLGLSNAGRSVDLDDLAAYVTSLSQSARSPFRNEDGTLSGAARRGKAIFLNPSVGCASCHVPPRFTDSLLSTNASEFIFHNVGTLNTGSGKRLGGELSGLDTPSLAGLWNSAPYLHDGNASNLVEIFRVRNTNDLHGVTSILSASQISDLVAYLVSIDSSANDEPEDADRDGISDAWEIKFGLNPAVASDAMADSDADGMNNLGEFVTGTNPNDNFSLLKFREANRQFLDLSFPSVAGKIYALEFLNSLSSSNWFFLRNIIGDGAEQILIETNSITSARFYRLRIVDP